LCLTAAVGTLLVSLRPGRLNSPWPVTEAGAHDAQVRGHLEQSGRRLAAPTIRGNWDKAVYAGLADGSERLLFAVNAVDEPRCACGAWRRAAACRAGGRLRPVGGGGRWSFSRLLIHCNEMTPGLREKLPPTDSRWRADIRALEQCKADQVRAREGGRPCWASEPASSHDRTRARRPTRQRRGSRSASARRASRPRRAAGRRSRRCRRSGLSWTPPRPPLPWARRCGGGTRRAATGARASGGRGAPAGHFLMRHDGPGHAWSYRAFSPCMVCRFVGSWYRPRAFLVHQRQSGTCRRDRVAHAEPV